MKRNTLIISVGLLLASGVCFGQNIPQSQVPSLVLNNFKQSFAKAYDVEWKIKSDQYYVEFETKPSKDHEVWYNQLGKLMKHKEDISKRKLPQNIQSKIKTDFKGYRIDDVKKITTGTTINYTVELNSAKEELKMLFDNEGKVLKQLAD